MRSTSRVEQKHTVVGVEVNQITKLIALFTPKHTEPVVVGDTFQVLFTVVDGKVSCDVNPDESSVVEKQPRMELSGMLKSQLVDILANK